MDNVVTEASEGRKVSSLDKIMDRIDRYCNPAHGEGVLFVRKIPENEQEKKKIDAANKVYDGMMLTLGNIATYSYERAKAPNGSMQESYQKVFLALDPLTQICRAIADNALTLDRDKPRELKMVQMGDKVYAYGMRDFSLWGRDFNNLAVLVRPNKWEADLGLRQKTQNKKAGMENLKESAQPRIQFMVWPKDYPGGLIVIRVDQSDLANNMEIFYDIEVGQEINLMDHLKFPGSLQEFTHHFTSTLTAKDLGVSFADILETMNTKLDSAPKHDI